MCENQCLGQMFIFSDVIASEEVTFAKKLEVTWAVDIAHPYGEFVAL